VAVELQTAQFEILQSKEQLLLMSMWLALHEKQVLDELQTKQLGIEQLKKRQVLLVNIKPEAHD
jgi:hypothetical protein